MNLLPRWVWMRSVTGRGDDAAPQPDPGDMGTAFGLDAAIEAQPEPLAPPGSEPPAPWTRRLDGRPRR